MGPGTGPCTPTPSAASLTGVHGWMDGRTDKKTVLHPHGGRVFGGKKEDSDTGHTWMDPEDTADISQSQKDKYRPTPFTEAPGGSNPQRQEWDGGAGAGE